MSTSPLTGLGEPDAIGKQALFQPPAIETGDDHKLTVQDKAPEGRKSKKGPIRRVHITTDLTMEALQTIQAIQQQHRIETGKVLPLWKAFSQAIVHYGRVKKRG